MPGPRSSRSVPSISRLSLAKVAQAITLDARGPGTGYHSGTNPIARLLSLHTGKPPRREATKQSMPLDVATSNAWGRKDAKPPRTQSKTELYIKSR